jgi:myosin heavy subunit
MAGIRLTLGPENAANQHYYRQTPNLWEPIVRYIAPLSYMTVSEYRALYPDYLSANQLQMNELEEQIKRLNQRGDAKQGEVILLQNQLSELQTLKSQIQQQAESSAQQQTDSSNQIEALQTEIAGKKQNIQSLTAKDEQNQRTIQRQKSAISGYIMARQELDTRIQSLQSLNSQLEKTNEDISKLEKEIEQLQQETTTLTEDAAFYQAVANIPLQITSQSTAANNTGIFDTYHQNLQKNHARAYERLVQDNTRKNHPIRLLLQQTTSVLYNGSASMSAAYRAQRLGNIAPSLETEVNAQLVRTHNHKLSVEDRLKQLRSLQGEQTHIRDLFNFSQSSSETLNNPPSQ